MNSEHTQDFWVDGWYFGASGVESRPRFHLLFVVHYFSETFLHKTQTVLIFLGPDDILSILY